MKPFLLTMLSVVLFTALGFAQVRIKVQEKEIAVEIDGKPFTALQKGAEANKPYFYPLLTASGKSVVRNFPMQAVPGEATDHPHQRGVWIGFEHVSGLNIWEIDPADRHPHSGSIQFGNVTETHDGEKTGGFTATAEWLNEDAQPILSETLTAAFYSTHDQNRMFDLDLKLKAKKTTTFEDSRDGIIGIRLATPFDESHGGNAHNAEGIVGADQLEGKHSSWVDWQADIDGEEVGVAMMDSPTNPHAPTTWRAKPFGLLFANPFAQRFYDRSRPDGSLTLQPGDELHLRYRFLIHPADADVAAAFREFSAQ